MTDATWTNIINGLVTVALAFIAYLQLKLKSQADKAAVKSEARSDKLNEISTKVGELQDSIPSNFRP